MSFDTHSLFAYSTIKTIVSQTATTLTLTVQTGDGAKFHTLQQVCIAPANTQATLANAMIGRITAIATDQLTIDISSGNREGSIQITATVAMQIGNILTPKVLTDIEGVVNTNTTNIAANTSSIATFTPSTTNTLTNKRITKRKGTVASSGTPTINTDNVDYFSITALAVAITSFTTNLSGTPVDGDTLWISILDNGTPRAIAWGASFESSGSVTLPITTVTSTRLDVGFVWNAATSKWHCVAVS